MEKAIFSYSLGIFVTLCSNFREHLKRELAIFIDDVFLTMLDSTNSNFVRKHLGV